MRNISILPEPIMCQENIPCNNSFIIALGVFVTLFVVILVILIAIKRNNKKKDNKNFIYK